MSASSRLTAVEGKASSNLDKINANVGRLSDVELRTGAVSTIVKNLQIPSVSVVNSLSVWMCLVMCLCVVC